MLGMGEDGHTASLFPGTAALNAHGRLCVANHIPQKKTWRMTLTFKTINQAKNICVYVIENKKGAMLKKIIIDNDADCPATHVGTIEHQALWIIDILNLATE